MKLSSRFLYIFCGGFFLSPITACAGDTKPIKIKKPVIYDLLTFKNKPDLGLSTEMAMVYEWEATLRDEAVMLRQMGLDKKPSAKTIEETPFIKVVQNHSQYKYIVIDIESLAAEYDDIAIQYVQLAKSAAPKSKVTWWNLGPGNVSTSQWTNKRKWRANFEKRKELVITNDFCILGAYFKKDDTIEIWSARPIPRISEARNLYGNKPIFITLSPHPFNAGRPWQYVDGELMGKAMDLLAQNQVDGIVLWSFEGTGKIQTWEESRSWVQAVRARTGPGGLYKEPGINNK